MRIGLNATCFNARPSGARQRFVELYGELMRRQPENEFVIFQAADARVADFMPLPANVTVRPTPIPSEGRMRKLVAGTSYWARGLRGDRFDVFERFNLPPVKGPLGRKILTIHDVRALRSKRTLERLAYHGYISRSIRAADRLITVSHTMKEELLSFFPWAPVLVVYNGVDVDAYDRLSGELVRSVQEKLALPSEFILTIGHLEPRKNHVRLVEAISRLPDAPPLVIVGNDSGEGDRLRRVIAERGVEDRVFIYKGLSDDEVRSMYRLCTLFVFPSLYEGFGIPVLEAMAARKPVALSDIPVFREITENQGVYFNPLDGESMAATIRNLLESPAAARSLVAYGARRVEDFAFTRLAGELEHVHSD